MASADDLPEELQVLAAEMERETVFRQKLQLDRMTKLASAPSIEAGECGTVLGVSMPAAASSAADVDTAISIIAANAMRFPGCREEPLGYSDQTEGDERRIDVYWPKVA